MTQQEFQYLITPAEKRAEHSLSSRQKWDAPKEGVPAISFTLIAGVAGVQVWDGNEETAGSWEFFARPTANVAEFQKQVDYWLDETEPAMPEINITGDITKQDYAALAAGNGVTRMEIGKGTGYSEYEDYRHLNIHAFPVEGTGYLHVFLDACESTNLTHREITYIPSLELLKYICGLSEDANGDCKIVFEEYCNDEIVTDAFHQEYADKIAALDKPNGKTTICLYPYISGGAD